MSNGPHPTGQHADLQERNLNWPRLLSGYANKWYWFAGCLFVALSLAYVYLWYVNPQFAVSAKLMLKTDDLSSGKVLQELALPPDNTNLENEIEILQSHNLIARTLQQLDFDASYWLVGQIKESEVYTDCPFQVELLDVDFATYNSGFEVFLFDSDIFELRPKSDGQQPLRGAFGDTLSLPLGKIVISLRPSFTAKLLDDDQYAKRLYRVKVHTVNSLRQEYLSRLKVQLARAESSILQLSLQHPVPQKAMDFLNKHVEVYLQTDLQEKNRGAGATIDFIDNQLAQITTDLSTIEGSREAFKVEKGIVNLESESQMVLEQMQTADAEIARIRAQLALIDQLERYVTNNTTASELSPAAIDINDPLLIRLVNKLSELQSEREKILTTSTENNPRLIPLRAEIELTRNALLENIGNIRQGMERTRREYAQELARFQNRVQNIPRTERELLEIERQFRLRENLYLYLLEKKAELSIAQAAAESDKKLIEPARVSSGPVSPRPANVYSVAFLLGLLIPAGAITLARILNTRVESREDISRAVNLPLAGVVGVSDDEDRLVVQKAQGGLVAEAFRALRTNLRFFGAADQPQVILITSSVSGEGKTFTSLNLAAIFAMSGKRTAIVGLDLRKPALQGSDAGSTRGISTYLSGLNSLAEIITPAESIPHLDFIYAGPIPPNPGELIATPKLAQLISELKSRYEVVILDTPPIGLVSDSLVFAELSDVVLYVVRQGVTTREQLSNLSQLVRERKLARVALVFNAVKHRPGEYQYYSGYAYTQGEKKSKKRKLSPRV